MKDNKEIIFNLNCKLTKEYADIIFKSLAFYEHCSFMFAENTRVAKKCRAVWILLNENCRVHNT